MCNFFKKFKLLLFLLILFISFFICYENTVSVFAETGESGILNSSPMYLGNGMILTKTIKNSLDFVNTWDVNLKITIPTSKKSSDTILIIDRSNSMAGEPLQKAREAATILVNQLLSEENGKNRVAILTFSSGALKDTVKVRTNFTNSLETATRAINGITTTYGATNTQVALHYASSLLDESAAEEKNIVLLSDGAPTLGYYLPEADKYLEEVNGHFETHSNIPQEAFDYNYTEGDLDKILYKYDEGKYYNSGNCAIAESNYLKPKITGNLYTVYLASSDGKTDGGEKILASIATKGKNYISTPDDLSKIFSSIGYDITSITKNYIVTDDLNDNIIISEDSPFGIAGSSELRWTPNFTPNKETGNFEAEITYRVESTKENLDIDDFYNISKSTTLSENETKIADFPVSKVAIAQITITETTISEEKCTFICTFVIEINGPENKEWNRVISEDQPVKITGRIRRGEYWFQEYNTDGKILLSYYDISYDNQNFTLNWGDKINANVTNLYETITIMVYKIWDDNSDQYNLRQTLENEELFIVITGDDGMERFLPVDLSQDISQYIFKYLPKKKDSKLIRYEISEQSHCALSKKTHYCYDIKNTNYITIIDGYNVINKLIHDEDVEIPKSGSISNVSRQLQLDAVPTLTISATMSLAFVSFLKKNRR